MVEDEDIYNICVALIPSVYEELISVGEKQPEK